jgi:hypothetical protein
MKTLCLAGGIVLLAADPTLLCYIMLAYLCVSLFIQ